MGCHFLLWGIFPTQGLNLGLLHCRQILYHLSHQGSPSRPLLSYVFYYGTELAEIAELDLLSFPSLWGHRRKRATGSITPKTQAHPLVTCGPWCYTQVHSANGPLKQHRGAGRCQMCVGCNSAPRLKQKANDKYVYISATSTRLKKTSFSMPPTFK